MIAYLKGVINLVGERSFILEGNGVGYEVFTHGAMLEELKIGEKKEFYIHSHIREDQFTLYGFKDLSEREFFKMLISVSGIGPKTGMEMLSQPISKLKKAIVEADVATISSTPGIGKKTAQRLIVDLKSKVGDLGDFDIADLAEDSDSSSINEAVDALEGLGYRKHQVLKVLESAPSELDGAEELVTYFLKNV